jgi:hypothetical protein
MLVSQAVDGETPDCHMAMALLTSETGRALEHLQRSQLVELYVQSE